MSIKIRSAKNKGMRFQKWVCEKIAKLFNVTFNNQDEQCEIHSRECGLSGTDIVLRGEIYKKFPFDIETKNTESFNVYKAIAQAQVNTAPGRHWLLFHKKNRSLPIVILDADLFFKILANTKDLYPNLKNTTHE